MSPRYFKNCQVDMICTSPTLHCAFIYLCIFYFLFHPFLSLYRKPSSRSFTVWPNVLPFHFLHFLYQNMFFLKELTTFLFLEWERNYLWNGFFFFLCLIGFRLVQTTFRHSTATTIATKFLFYKICHLTMMCVWKLLNQ
jgi:hypothetical protein